MKSLFRIRGFTAEAITAFPALPSESTIVIRSF